MTIAIERLNPVVRPSWWLRLFTDLMAWQEQRARREIDRHAHLLAGGAAFVAPYSADPVSGAQSATWNAVLAGMTCESGAPVRDSAPIDFSRL